MWLLILSGIIFSMNLSGYIFKWLNPSEATFLYGKSYTLTQGLNCNKI